MAKNEGKKFEEDFKNSVPADAYIYKLKDAGGWSNATNTRFTISNMCDFIMYSKPTLFLLELKSTKGKSLPFNNIKDNQVKELLAASDTEGIQAGLVINLRSVNETYYLNIKDFKKYVETTERKSISLEYLRSEGILIEQELKKTRYKYNIKEFIKWGNKMKNVKKALLIAGIATVLLYNTSFAASRGFSWLLEQGIPENIRILKDNKYNKEYIVIDNVGIVERTTK